MDHDNLKRLAGKHHVPLGSIEKDYAVTVLLSAISRFPENDKMIFKGGTAIKKMYFQNARFSEDIDFTCKYDISLSLGEFLSNEIKRTTVKFNEIKTLETKGASKKFSVKYEEHNQHINSVKIDLSLREQVIQDNKNLQVLHIHDDLPNNFRIFTMSLEEIMSEKIRAIIYSPQPLHRQHCSKWSFVRNSGTLRWTRITGSVSNS